MLNKIDQISIEELDIVYRIPHSIPVSAHHEWNFDDLLELMWKYLALVRVYTKVVHNHVVNSLKENYRITLLQLCLEEKNHLCKISVSVSTRRCLRILNMPW